MAWIPLFTGMSRLECGNAQPWSGAFLAQRLDVIPAKAGIHAFPYHGFLKPYLARMAWPSSPLTKSTNRCPMSLLLDSFKRAMG